ncbi:MAG: ABC transporter ATP-binding protein [Bacteriovorax sp.]|nr:ABC transporter ATP-binding protein [Bacteriovorax sp.]
MISSLKSNYLFIDPKSRKLLGVSILLGIVWFILELSFVYILQSFLLSLNLLQPDKLQVPSWFPTGIYHTMILLISFGIIRAFISYAKSFFAIQAMHSSIRYCRTFLIDRGLDSKYFNSSADYLTLFSDRVNQAGIFVQYLSLGIVCFFSVILFFAFGIFYAPKEMVFSLTLTVILMIPIKKVTYKIQSVAETLMSEWNGINSKVIMVKRNIFFLAVYDLINFEKKEIRKNLLSFEKSYSHFASASSLLGALPLLVGIFVLSICSYLSVEFFHTDGMKVLSFFYIFLRMTQGLSELNSTYAILKLSYPSFREVKKSIEDLNLEKEKTLGTKQLVSGNSVNLSINNLSFGYPNDSLLFKDLLLNLTPGDKLIIKGPSGAGKSTLLKLILGLEKPTSGNVTINDNAVHELDSKWRMNLGYVGPEPFLIPGTIKENLAFGNVETKHLEDSDYNKVLELSGLLGDFKNNNVTLNTSLAEASFLSTGQRQRMAIARAFLRKPSIMIFDEATANLDSETEEQIVSNLKNIGNESITIIVTHKNSFDKIGTKFLNVGLLNG